MLTILNLVVNESFSVEERVGEDCPEAEVDVYDVSLLVHHDVAVGGLVAPRCGGRCQSVCPAGPETGTHSM